jgi:anti-sigma factor RsiW
MMQRPSDEALIAYLDGELDESVRGEIAAALDHDPDLQAHVQRLGESAGLLRAAFDEVMREPLPDRLIAAARGETTKVVSIGARLRRGMFQQRRWWTSVAAAASLALIVGGSFGYFAGDEDGATEAREAQANAAAGSWLDNIAGYHKLFVNAGSNDGSLADVPASDSGDVRKVTQKLPQDFHLPNLKPWGLVFQGARFLFVEGRPATQLFYTTDNKALGPLTVVVASSPKGDLQPTFDRRDDLNVLYWRHHGHAYALVGGADIGYLWNIANDIAWQLDAI